MDKFLERFSNFFVRSVAPSSIFFVLIFFYDSFLNQNLFYEKITFFLTEISDIDKTLLYIFLVLIFLAYGYLNQILTQFLDNFIKENYDEEDEKFNQLREETKIKFLKNKNHISDILPLNDYNLYIFLSSDKSISVSTSYVDEVKNIHSLRISLLLSSLINFTYCDKYFSIPFFVFSIILFCLLHGYVKSRYKVRNKRLYINYLLKEEKKEKFEKETKILYKGRSR